MHDNENIVRNKGHFPLLERRNPQYSLSRVSWLDMVIEQEHNGVIYFLEKSNLIRKQFSLNCAMLVHTQIESICRRALTL